MKKLRKGAFFTDIHWGRKSNSPIHNQDCLNYIDWFCDHVRSDPTIDYVGFLGDWNESRTAINLATADFSYRGAKKLNDLGIPVFFVVGNHDLYYKHNREIFSTVVFNEFKNFKIIDQPSIITEIGDGAFFSPFLFHEEYDQLDKYLNLPFWAGHFEFKGFKITGYNVLMPTGPDHTKFKGPNDILSGHFHQRQGKDNIQYIGNTFPMDFGDVNDFNRGLCVYDHVTLTKTFFNWVDCPKYVKVDLAVLLTNGYTLPIGARVKCITDGLLSYEDSLAVREEYTTTYQLREFTLEEPESDLSGIADTITSTTNSLDNASTISSIDTVDQLVVQMLGEIKNDTISSDKLILQYNKLL